jgi:hypothetical protein
VAGELRRIEPAKLGVADQAIPQAVVHIAGGDHRLMQHGELGGRQDIMAVEAVGQKRPRQLDGRACFVERRRDRDDTLKILRKALRFDQRLATAGRASQEIVVSRRAPVISRADGLAGEGGLVGRAIGEVDLALKVVRGPGGVDQRRLMPHIGL